jgi:hypothetical protein
LDLLFPGRFRHGVHFYHDLDIDDHQRRALGFIF